ncbi:MAG: indolepyruvate oxidoreductase subunit B, partial [Alphaproteobacteria bacterium]
MNEQDDRPTTILIGALGGEGGGVLTSWITAAAMAGDLPVQSTSVPGVAQRTGATTYYVEVFPRTNAELAGRRPVFALFPNPGLVDVVVASEQLEAARAMERGFVTPDRTTLIASRHRVYAIGEKSAAADGRFPGKRMPEAAAELAARSIIFDAERIARESRSSLNAVL